MVRRDHGRAGDARVLRRPLRRRPRPALTGHRHSGSAPSSVVALSMAWGLWELRPELRAVPYLDDSSLHQQMVRVAAARISQGHLPLTSWFPYLGLGSPQFLHYQSLPSMVSGAGRHGGRSRHGVPVVPLSAARALADHRLLERPALRAEPLDGRVGRRGGALPRLGRRHRLRDEGLRLGGLRRVDPALGLVDAPAGVGLHLPGAVVAARGLLGRPLHHADGRPALRDRVPRLRAPRRVALHRPFGPVAPDRPRRGARGGGRAGVGLGHRPAAPAVPLGGAQPGARGNGARERLRRRADADVAASPATSTTTATRRPGCPSSRSSSPSGSASAWRAGARSWPAAPSS